MRAERVVADLRPGVVAEQATGPLDALFHAVDVRRISATTGRHHPRHVAHWLQPTITFPLREATAVDRSLADSDVRYAMHPLGVRQPLRARRIAGDREPFVDRIQEQHFAATPERWFGQPGGFTVRVCGLPAGSRGRSDAERVADSTRRRPSARPRRRHADGARAAVARLARRRAGRARPRDDRRRGHRHLAAQPGRLRGPREHRPRRGRRHRRRRRRAAAGRAAYACRCSASARSGVRPAASSPARRSSSRARRPDRLPRSRTRRSRARASCAACCTSRSRRWMIRGERLLHIAAGRQPLRVGRRRRRTHRHARGRRASCGSRRRRCSLPGRARPGRPLPPAGRAADAQPRPGRARPRAGGPARRAAAAANGRRTSPTGAAGERLRARLRRSDRESRRAALPAVPAPDLDGPRSAVGDLDGARPQRAAGRCRRRRRGVRRDRRAREADPDRIALAVRFECSEAGATLCPGEIAWSADDGRTVLIHLPQLDAEPLAADAPWPAEATFGFASEAVRVGEDGSTWASESTAGRRVTLGEIAPIAEAAGLRRRRVRWRRLCALGPRGLDRVAAGDARADAARPPRRRRPARTVRVLRGRAAAALAGRTRPCEPAQRHDRLRGGCDDAHRRASRRARAGARPAPAAPDAARLAQRNAAPRRAGGLARDPPLRLAAGRARGSLGALAGA